MTDHNTYTGYGVVFGFVIFFVMLFTTADPVGAFVGGALFAAVGFAMDFVANWWATIRGGGE